jgi:hypothetical protein
MLYIFGEQDIVFAFSLARPGRDDGLHLRFPMHGWFGERRDRSLGGRT